MDVISFRAKTWVYSGPAAWTFITLPKQQAARIRLISGPGGRGWGAVRVSARIGDSEWKTSIFPDAKSGSYVLPLKAEIRKREKIQEGQILAVELRLDSSAEGAKRGVAPASLQE